MWSVHMAVEDLVGGLEEEESILYDVPLTHLFCFNFVSFFTNKIVP